MSLFVLLFFFRDTCNYHRSGRTDKGVSALGQVISIDLRSNLLEGPGVKVREGGTAHERTGENNLRKISSSFKQEFLVILDINTFIINVKTCVIALNISFPVCLTEPKVRLEK